jgi:hypothetical protein
VLVAAVTIVLNYGAGVNDLWVFLLWTFLFSGCLAAIAVLLRRLYCRCSLSLSYFLAMLLGGASGAVWTYLVAILLGPWIGAFSVPVFACWVAGGASGMIAAAGGCFDMRPRLIAVESAVIVLICLITAMGADPLYNALSRNQSLEVVFVKWKPSFQALSSRQLIPEYDKYRLTDSEMFELESVGLTGELTVVGAAKHGSGKHSCAVIIMQHQITDAVELLQPDRAEVIYLQDGNEWKMYPPDAPTLRRVIRLEVAPISPRNTQCLVELSYGARQGGLAFSW